MSGAAPEALCPKGCKANADSLVAAVALQHYCWSSLAFRESREFAGQVSVLLFTNSQKNNKLDVASTLLYSRRGFNPGAARRMSRAKEMYMTTDAKVAKQVIEDELELQINTAKAELEVLASRAESTMVKAEVQAYETLMPKLQAIQQKMPELKKSTGAQWQQTKADLEALISDFKESVKGIVSAAGAD
jgi:hypothetical protein